MATLTDIVPSGQEEYDEYSYLKCGCSPFGDHECGLEKTPEENLCPAHQKVCLYLPKTAAALEWGLGRLDVDVRQNIRRHAVEWCKGDGGWQLMNGRAAARFRSDLESNFVVYGYKGLMPLRFGREAFNEAMDSLLFDKEVDPFLEYLNELPAPTGRRKLHLSLAHCFDVSPEYAALAEWASQSIFLGAVWRAYEPGTTLDEIPILVGDGGMGKTTYLRKAVPQHIPGLYDSGLDLSSDAKSRVEALQGKVIVEIADMAGATAGDANKIKDFISRTDDGSVRLAYRRDPEPCPRRCVLVGTADRAKFLRPDKNPRRFVPIVLDGGKAYRVFRYMDTYRDRLWSEAKDLYTKGIPPRLPDELKQVAHDMALRAML